MRPTSVMRTPESLKDRLEADQFKLYSLIWKRTVACQMVPAIFDTVAIDLLPENTPEAARLRANGSTLVEPGFIAVYQEGTDDVKDDEADRSHCRRSKKGRRWNWQSSRPTSISPIHRRATPKPAW